VGDLEGRGRWVDRGRWGAVRAWLGAQWRRRHHPHLLHAPVAARRVDDADRRRRAAPLGKGRRVGLERGVGVGGGLNRDDAAGGAELLRAEAGEEADVAAHVDDSAALGELDLGGLGLGLGVGVGGWGLGVGGWGWGLG